MDIPRSPMDRKRTRRGPPFLRKLGSLLKGGLILVGVVAAVAAIPVVFLWIFLPDEPAASSEATLEPQAPLPPRVEEVTFARGVTPLDGVLHVPPEPGPHPAVAVVGATAGQAASHLGDLGDALARAGIVALTVLDQGGGSAMSDRATATLTDNALAALGFLRAQSDVRWTRLGILDLSEGGSVASQAASRSDDLAFVVMVGTPIVPEGGDVAESELAELDVPALWLLGEWGPGAPAETMALIDALRAPGRPFTYHVITDAARRDADGSEPPADIGSVIDAWMRDTGLR